MRRLRSSLFVAALAVAGAAAAQVPAVDVFITDPALAETRAVIVMQGGVRTPAATHPGYGGRFWLDRADAKSATGALFADQGPSDTFAAIGHLGQWVTITPSKRLVNSFPDAS